jgi:hypothetical protein
MSNNVCETECPICMEIIDLCKNCATTECGHQFHSNCLMKSIAFNGFGCPYCRFEMVEEIDDSEDEDYEDENADEDADEDEAEDDGETLEDNQDNEEDDDVHDEDNSNEELPSFELIQKKFIEKGITYECLVKSIMFNSMIYHKNENFTEYQKYNTFMEELFFDIISKYEPEEEEKVKTNKNEFDFYFLKDEYIQRKYQKDMETTLEKFLALDEDDEDDYDDDDDDDIIFDNNIELTNNAFLNNRFMEVI